MNLVYICGRQGVPIITYLRGLNIVRNLNVFMNDRAINNSPQFISNIDVNPIDETDNWLNRIMVLNPDVILSFAYPHKLPMQLYQYCPYGVVNCHTSLLPRYRGPSPIFHAIKNNETETGITFHFINEKFDAGDIILQKKIPINSDECSVILWRKMVKEIIRTLPEVLENRNIWKEIAVPQNKNLHTYCKVPTRLDRTITNSQSLLEAKNTVRACGSIHGAWTKYGEIQLKVCHVSETKIDFIAHRDVNLFGDKNFIYWRSNDGWLKIDEYIWKGNRYKCEVPEILLDQIRLLS